MRRKTIGGYWLPETPLERFVKGQDFNRERCKGGQRISFLGREVSDRLQSHHDESRQPTGQS
jgi:hypothetical protein